MTLNSWNPFLKNKAPIEYCKSCDIKKKKGEKIQECCKQCLKNSASEKMRVSRTEAPSILKTAEAPSKESEQSPKRKSFLDIFSYKEEKPSNEPSNWDVINDFLRKESLEYPSSITPQQALELEEAPTMLWPILDESNLPSYLSSSLAYLSDGKAGLIENDKPSSENSKKESTVESEDNESPVIVVAKLKGVSEENKKKGEMIDRSVSAISMPVENEVKEVNKEEKEKESKKKVEKKEEKQKDIGAKAEKEEEIISEEEKEVETEKESETEKEDEEIEHETEREEEEEDINEKLIIEEKIKVAKLKEHNDDVKEVSEKDDNEKKEKVKKIEKAILEKDREKLKELAKSKYGLISSSLRSDAWYILLHGDKNHSKRSKVKTHPDDEQMKRDGQRAFKNIPRNIDDVKRKRKRVELIELLKAIFQREPELNYYQGFHEIASVLLLVLGKRKVANCIQNLSLNYLRDSMQGTLGPMMRQMALSSYLIKVEEPELYEFLLQTKAQSYYGLSWVLTWFTLGSESLTRCSRYIDLFLASNPILPIYIMAAATIKRKGKILKLEKNRELVYNYLKTFPSELEDEELIEKALSFYKRFPPEKLQKESKVALGENSCINRYESNWEKIKSKEDYKKDYDKVQEWIKLENEAKKARVIQGCGPEGCDIPKKKEKKTNYLYLFGFLFSILIVFLGIYIKKDQFTLALPFSIGSTKDNNCQCEVKNNNEMEEPIETKEEIKASSKLVIEDNDVALDPESIVSRVMGVIQDTSKYTDFNLEPINIWVQNNLLKKVGFMKDTELD